MISMSKTGYQNHCCKASTRKLQRQLPSFKVRDSINVLINMYARTFEILNKKGAALIAASFKRGLETSVFSEAPTVTNLEVETVEHKEPIYCLSGHLCVYYSTLATIPHPN